MRHPLDSLHLLLLSGRGRSGIMHRKKKVQKFKPGTPSQLALNSTLPLIFS